MKIKMIDVQTSNKVHAIDICMLVDKLKFLKELKRLREKWKIKKLYVKKIFLNKSIVLDTNNLLQYTGINTNDVGDKHDELNQDIEELLKKFNRGKNFKPVVEYALITGVIPKEVYQSCYFDVATLNEPADISKPEKYQYVIVVSPRTEKKEVEKAFKELKKYIKEKINFESRIQSNLEKSGNLITDEEVKEIEKQAQLIQEEYIKYREKTKNLPIDEVVNEYSHFSERTQPMRDKYEALRHKIPLSLENPEDVELINLFHAGNIYKSALLDSGTRRNLEKTRKLYWKRYDDFLNGKSDKAKTYDEMVHEWKNSKCPIYRAGNDDEAHEKKCTYCKIDNSYYVHVLAPYEKLLEQKVNS